MSMFCYQCSMSMPNGCGSGGQTTGSCGKDENLARLQDIMIYGLKGIAAYRVQADHYGADCKAIDDVVNETLYFTLTNSNFNFDQHVGQVMKVGQTAVDMMTHLDKAHTDTYGQPQPVKVPQNRVEGKAIIVSGHDHHALRKLLEQSEGKGVNVYTHSEQLPSHAYPELSKYRHLKGNVGKAWFDQKDLFSKFNGAILVNTNCIVPPKGKDYADRVFTYAQVGIEGATHIENDDFTPLINKALELPETNWQSDETVVTGHHHSVILSLAPQIVEAVKGGKIRRFFVIAGCDAPGKAGDYYRELARQVPEDCVVITSSCGKYRFNDLEFGNVPGTEIPRLLDLGQCNDSIGGVIVASKLAEVFECGVNDLPLSIVLSWMEQKAVAILLGLLSIGVKDIRVGPRAPEFFNEDITNFLVENFDLKLTGDPAEDLKDMLG
ncbi:hydroxylamine reductase [Desulfurispira natronophila]|uniref:Hydroxylamine reductase n=1 Tax=Desulfurispira natronophila TaxID=682562 RepID=A0A7W7Y368_9BACT|nr:hydroxylamine reductase [Desulfurispira natronophila]MBB5021246.1 hydroxylamine reductase [Desulfurispira natronophila]